MAPASAVSGPGPLEATIGVGQQVAHAATCSPDGVYFGSAKTVAVMDGAWPEQRSW